MTFRAATTTAVGVALFATVCAAASVDEVNKRFMAGTVSDQIADAGILIHQFGTTDNSYPGPNMWQPCDIAAGTCWFDVPGIGKFDDRVSCSITSNDAPKTTTSEPSPSLHNVPPAGGIGLFSYDKGGVILNPNVVNMTCSYQGDGGTMTRVADTRGGGCGCQNAQASQWSKACIEPQINTPGGCDNRCPTPADPKLPWLSCHQCAWDADHLSSMMHAQRAGTSGGALIYNEVLIQAAPWRANPSAFIDAFFYPKGSDPGSEAGVTKTVAAYKAFKAAYPQSDAPLLVLDAAYPLTPTGNGPFTVAPEASNPQPTQPAAVPQLPCPPATQFLTDTSCNGGGDVPQQARPADTYEGCCQYLTSQLRAFTFIGSRKMCYMKTGHGISTQGHPDWNPIPNSPEDACGYVPL